MERVVVVGGGVVVVGGGVMGTTHALAADEAEMQLLKEASARPDAALRGYGLLDPGGVREVNPARRGEFAGGLRCRRDAIVEFAPGVVLVTGPGGRGMTCAPAIPGQLRIPKCQDSIHSRPAPASRAGYPAAVRETMRLSCGRTCRGGPTHAG